MQKIRKILAEDFKEPLRTALCVILWIIEDSEEKLGKENVAILKEKIEFIKTIIESLKQK